MSYTWDFKETKKIRETKPTEKDINYLYQKVIKGKDLRNSIKDALKEGVISTDFNLRSYIHHMNKLDSYKALLKEQKETYRLNCIRVLDLYNNFTSIEITLITGFEYAYVFSIINK